MPGGEVVGQTFPESLAVGGADLAALLEFDDTPTDLPGSGRKDAR